MLLFRSEKVRDEFSKATVSLRLVVEQLAMEYPGICEIFRVKAKTSFESGVHSTGIACDIILMDAREETIFKACQEVNKKFPVSPLHKQVCTLQIDPTNLPSGRRIDVPHVHVQIQFDWLADPRAFLKAFGYLEKTEKA